MATLKDLLDSGMSRDEINALLSQSTMGTRGFQQDGYDYGPPMIPDAPPSDMLPPQQYRGESMANTPPRQFLSDLAKPQPPRFTVDPSDGLQRMTDRPGEAMQADMNTIRNNSTGVVTKMPSSGQRSHDVWADGPQVLHREQLADGTTRVTKRVPALDGFGRQSAKMVQEIEIPDYLNPAKIKELEFQKRQAETDNLRTKNLNPYGVRLKQGERFKSDGSGDVESIPGSDLHKKQAAKLSDASSQVDTHNKGVDALIKNINVLIGDDSEGAQQHPGLRGSVGYIDANIMPFTQDQATAKSFIKSLKDKSAVSGLQSIRQAGTAPGSITEKEWPIFQNLINNLDAAQDIESYKSQLRELRAEAIASKGRAAHNYQQSTGREYVAPVIPNAAPGAVAPAQTAQKSAGEVSGKHKRISSDAEFEALKSGTIYIAPDGTTRTKR